MKQNLIILLLLCISCHKSTEPDDCNGVEGGSSVEDNCSTCDNDSSNDCVQDCNGEWGGSAIIDTNGACCNNWEQDDCDICFGEKIFTNSSGYPCEESSGGDCSLQNGDCDCTGNVLDECGVCAGNGLPCLNLFLSSSVESLVQDDTLILTVIVENADYLYAVSFSLHYNRDQNGNPLLTNTMSYPMNEAVSEGDVFIDPLFPTNDAFISENEINIAISESEKGDVIPMTSGSICEIKLIAAEVGSSYIEIHNLQMIESDGASIEGLSTINLEGIRLTVSE